MNAQPPTLLRSGSQTFASSLVGVVFGFATSVILARWLGPAGKGQVDLAMATTSLLVLLLGLSAPGGITYVIARGLGTARSLIGASLPLLLIQGVLSAALIMIVPSIVGDRMPTGALLALTAAGIGFSVSLTGASASFRAVALGLQRIATANLIDLIARGSLAALLLIAAATATATAVPGSAAPVMAIGAFTASLAVATLAAFVLTRKELRVPGPSGLSTAIRFAAPSYLANVTQFLNYRLDLFLVGLFLGPSAVGLYALATSLAQLVWLLSNSLATALLPRVASGAGSGSESVLAEGAAVSRIALLLSLLGAVALGFAAPVLVPVVYGPSFSSSVPALVLLLPGIVVFASVNVIASVFAGLGRPDYNLAIGVCGLALTVPLDLLLIPAVGIAGAAIATSASYVAGSVMTSILFRRLGGGPIRAIFLVERSDWDAALARVRTSWTGG